MLTLCDGKWEVTGGFLALLLWFGAGNGVLLTAIVLSAAALHELGHYVVLRLFGASVRNIRLTIFGAEIETDMDMLSYPRTLMAIVAGPFVNLICGLTLAGLTRRFHVPFGYVMAGAHLLLAGFNLLPIRPLDGGRTLELLGCWILGPTMGVRVRQIIDLTVSVVLGFVLLRLIQSVGGSLWLCPAVMGLMLHAIQEGYRLLCSNHANLLRNRKNPK